VFKRNPPAFDTRSVYPPSRAVQRRRDDQGQAVLRLIVEAASPRPDDTVLDVACGPGFVACAFAHAKQRVST